jgi:hypothetical protein
MSIISTGEMGDLCLCDADGLDLEGDGLVFLVFLEGGEDDGKDKEKGAVEEEEEEGLVVDDLDGFFAIHCCTELRSKMC